MKKGVNLQSLLQSTRTSSAAHNSPIAYVITYQFSPASFLSMCFHTHKKNFRTTVKNVVV